MEASAPYTPVSAPNPTLSSFTPVKKLFHAAWDRVQKHLLQLFLLNVLVFVAAVILLVVSALILFIGGFFSPVTAGTAFSSATGILAGVLVFIIVLAAIIGMSALQIATVFLLGETVSGGASTLQLFKMGLRKIVPLTVVSLLSGFIVMGGLIVFIIPGILFGILLSFASYFVILDNLSPFEAIKKSVYVVSKNFSAVFIRMTALFAVSFIVGIIFNILNSQEGTITILTGIGSFVFNLLFGWVSVAFMMFTFQEAKRMAGEGRGKITWMIGIALLGWIILLVGGYFAFRAIPANSNTVQPGIFNNVPSVLPIVATPAASLTPASPSASVRATATPRASATPRATATPRAATSSANR